MKPTFKLTVRMAFVLMAAFLFAGCADENVEPSPDVADEATLILNIGLNGTELSSTRTPDISAGDYNGAESGELMRTLRVIIVDGNDMVEHNIFFDGLDNVASQTTDRVKVSGKNRKTIYMIANERAVSIGSEATPLSGLLEEMRPGSNLSEDYMRALVILSDLHKGAWDDAGQRLLPISGIEHLDVGEAREYTSTFWIHRAAVKYSFIVNNGTDRVVSIDSIKLRGATDREFLFPAADSYTQVDKTDNTYRPVTYRTPAETGFREVGETIASTVPAKTMGHRLAKRIYYTEGLVLRGIFNDGDGNTVEEVYKIAVKVNGVWTPWRNLDWFYPGSPHDIKNMVDIPRNTHIVVQLNLTSQGMTFVACVQPYAEQKLDPFFGLDRDLDGNLIREYEGDGTFWSDNPRYGINGDMRKTIWKDEDGDEIRKKFKDGSFLCTERMYRDWIHDETEVDHEYTFEKNIAGGCMVIIRSKTDSRKISDLLDDAHEHDIDDRPLFVKLTRAFRDRQEWDIPDGTHLMVTYGENGKPSYSQTDAAGDTIIQANGYQFLESAEMEPWMDTYLVKHLVSTDPDGTKHFVEQVKDRYGTIINDDYRSPIQIMRK